MTPASSRAAATAANAWNTLAPSRGHNAQPIDDTAGRLIISEITNQRAQHRDRRDYPRLFFALGNRPKPGEQRGQHRHRDRGAGITGATTGGRTEVGAEDERRAKLNT